MKKRVVQNIVSGINAERMEKCLEKHNGHQRACFNYIFFNKLIRKVSLAIFLAALKGFAHSRLTNLCKHFK